jgi:hypothetical protein
MKKLRYSTVVLFLEGIEELSQLLIRWTIVDSYSQTKAMDIRPHCFGRLQGYAKKGLG